MGRRKKWRHNQKNQQHGDGQLAGTVEEEIDTNRPKRAGRNQLDDGPKKWTRGQKIQFSLLLIGFAYASLTAILWYTTREGIHSGQRPCLIVDKIELAAVPHVR